MKLVVMVPELVAVRLGLVAMKLVVMVMLFVVASEEAASLTGNCTLYLDADSASPMTTLVLNHVLGSCDKPSCFLTVPESVGKWSRSSVRTW